MGSMNTIVREQALYTVRTFMLMGCVLAAATGAFGEPSGPIRLVDAHTAGTLPRGSYQLESRLYPSGSGENGAGMLVGITIGLWDKFNLGLAYGGEGIVGRGRNAEFNPVPGCLVKYRILDENFLLPGIAVGFDYQGYGGIAHEGSFGYSGYIYKSQGFFAAFSKSYLFLKTVQLGLHGDVGLSVEEWDRVTWPNLVTGVDIGFSGVLSLVAEYDWGFNTRDRTLADRNPPYARPQDGYLHAGVRLTLSPGFAVEIDARDITENRRNELHRVGWSREIKVVYTSRI